jgi:hypothetical protein
MSLLFAGRTATARLSILATLFAIPWSGSLSCKQSPPSPGAPPELDAGAPTAIVEASRDAGPDAEAPDAAPNDPDASAAPGEPQPAVVDREAFAHAVCGARRVRRDHDEWTCSCPGFTGSENAEESLGIKAIYTGAFTSAGLDEAVVETSGCESGASSSQTYGGYVFLQRGSAGWKLGFYHHTAPGKCTPLRSSDGRTSLVCDLVRGHMGLYPHEFRRLSFTQRRGGISADEDLFLQFSSNGDDAQLADASGKIYLLDVPRFEILGREAYTAGDARALSIEIDVQSRIKCVAAPPLCTKRAVDSRLLQLRFAFDGSKLVITPASRPALRQLKRRQADSEERE